MSHYAVKICMLGDSSVGKSSVAVRFAQDNFVQGIESTIGAAFLWQFLTTEQGTLYKLHIWDTAGQERYKSLAPMYYRGVAVIVIVYDVTNRESLIRGAKEWVGEITKMRNPATTDVLLALVGNKIDLEDENRRQVPEKEGRQYAEDIGALFYETSAKTGQNVIELFTGICSGLEANVNINLPLVSQTKQRGRHVSVLSSTGEIIEPMPQSKCCS